MANRKFHMALLPWLLLLTAFGCGGGNSDSDSAGDSVSQTASSIECATQWTPCGGDVVGTWVIDDFCLNSTSEALTSSVQSVLVAVITQPECQDAIQDKTPDYNISGEYDFGQDGSGHQDVTVELSVPLTLSGDCLNALLAQPVTADQAVCDQLAAQLTNSFDAASKSALPSTTCTFEQSACQCEVHSLPQVSQTDGQYALDGNSFVSPDGDTFDYCVSGEGATLQLNTPDTAYARGTIVLRRQ